MQAEINLDELVRATYLDENIMPESIKHVSDKNITNFRTPSRLSSGDLINALRS